MDDREQRDAVELTPEGLNALRDWAWAQVYEKNLAPKFVMALVVSGLLTEAQAKDRANFARYFVWQFADQIGSRSDPTAITAWNRKVVEFFLTWRKYAIAEKLTK